jgi:hypothetical protein
MFPDNGSIGGGGGQTFDTNTGAVGADTMRIVTEDTERDAILRSNWIYTIGNSIETTKYTGVETGNPSGSTDNVKTVVYKTGATTVITQTMEYDMSNDVIKVTTS